MVKKYLVKITDSCHYSDLRLSWSIVESEKPPEIFMKKSKKCDGSWNNTYPMCDKCSEIRTRKITGVQLYTKKRVRYLKASGYLYGNRIFTLEEVLGG